MEQYAVLLMAPESLLLIVKEDKDIWDMLKIQSFLEEFYAGEKLP